MYKLVLLRHGESVWNKENRFTGWTDVELTKKGILEAHEAGKTLNKEGYTFDIAYTSVLKRAIHTLEIVLKEMSLTSIEVVKDYRLNERHYGALQGLNKTEMAHKYGEEQVQIWRRSFDVLPPALELTDERYPGNDQLYKGYGKDILPNAESLKTTIERFMPYYDNVITPTIKSGKSTLIVAHGNTLRALVMKLDNISSNDITGLNIPTGIPLIYELTDDLKPITHYYLAENDELNEAINTVKQQGKT